jgi:hypothetical protein
MMMNKMTMKAVAVVVGAMMTVMWIPDIYYKRGTTVVGATINNRKRERHKRIIELRNIGISAEQSNINLAFKLISSFFFIFV